MVKTTMTVPEISARAASNGYTGETTDIGLGAGRAFTAIPGLSTGAGAKLMDCFAFWVEGGVEQPPTARAMIIRYGICFIGINFAETLKTSRDTARRDGCVLVPP